MLRIRGLSKRFGAVTAVADVSLDVPAGEITALVGPNGAGKTTLLKTTIGFVRPTAGTVEVLGTPVQADPVRARRLVGYVPQRVAFADDASTGTLIRHYAALKGLNRSAAADALRAVDLLDVEARPVRTLSGGMTQRLGLAVALLGAPPLLVLDEPTVSLDPDGSVAVRAALAAHRAHGGAVVIATHLLADAELLADRICLLRAGRLLAHDSLAALAARFVPDLAGRPRGWRQPGLLEDVYRAAMRAREAA